MGQVDQRRPMGRDEHARMRRQHIFAVNGDPELLDMLRVLFQHEDYNVTTTNFVPDTFDQIAALKPDVLLVDLVWGERAGWELLEELRAGARTRGIPVVVLSTTPRYLARVKAEPDRYGGDALLEKPFVVDDILGAIRSLIGTA